MRHRWSNAEARSGRRPDRGASLVEYALVFTVLVVASIQATRWLSQAGDSQVENQANCISSRPAPPSCQMKPAFRTTSTVPVSTTADPTTTTTLAPSPTTAPTTTTTRPATTTTQATTTTTAPALANATFATSKSGLTVTVTVTVKRGSANVSGATLSFDIAEKRLLASTSSSTGSCTTGSDGRCTFTYTGTDGGFLGLGRTTSVTFTPTNLATTNPGPLPSAQTVSF